MNRGTGPVAHLIAVFMIIGFSACYAATAEAKHVASAAKGKSIYIYLLLLLVVAAAVMFLFSSAGKNMIGNLIGSLNKKAFIGEGSHGAGQGRSW